MRRILRKLAEQGKHLDVASLGDLSTLADPSVVDALVRDYVEGCPLPGSPSSASATDVSRTARRKGRDGLTSRRVRPLEWTFAVGGRGTLAVAVLQRRELFATPPCQAPSLSF
eukprot:ctg_100.g107